MRKPASFLIALALGVTAAISVAGSALASPITYTEQATASGCLGNVTNVGGMITCAAGTSFTDALVTITLNGDTANVTNPSTGFFENVVSAGTATVNVAGLGSATFSDEIAAFSQQSVTVVGFADLGFATPLDILDTGNSLLATYDLESAIGPISGSPAFISINEIFPTSDGGFVLMSVPATSSFTAVTVPEPAIGHSLPVVVAFGSVLIGVKLLERNRKRRSLAS